jgi:hypothetical protein
VTIGDWFYNRWLAFMCRQDGGHKTSDDDPTCCDRCGMLDADGIPTYPHWSKRWWKAK